MPRPALVSGPLWDSGDPWKGIYLHLISVLGIQRLCVCKEGGHKWSLVKIATTNRYILEAGQLFNTCCHSRCSVGEHP